MNLQDLTHIKNLIDTPRYSVIVSHRNPDGDAIGSSLALAHFLQKKGHTVHIVFPSEYPPLFQFLVEDVDVSIYDLHSDAIKPKLKMADVIFALDFNALDRIDRMGEFIHGLTCPKVMIDHHIDPEPFAEYAFWRESASSTAELVYDLMKEGEYMRFMDPQIATSIMCGILTDTGSLSYSVSPEVLVKVAELLKSGVDYRELQDKIFNSWSAKYLKLLGHCLSNRMELLDEHQTGIIHLTKSDYADFDIQRGDTEGIVNYLLKLQEVTLAVFITEQPNIIKFSFRSKGDFSVAAMAAAHFKGGGHVNASGGFMHSSLEAAIRKVKDVIKNYPQLSKSEIQIP